MYGSGALQAAITVIAACQVKHVVNTESTGGHLTGKMH
jgi:hypothetical protein